MNGILEPSSGDEPAGRPGRALQRPPADHDLPEPQADVAGFCAFYRMEVPRLVTFLVWSGARLADAADIAQDTMVDAFRQWSTLETPRAWVRRVASRKYARRIAHVETPVDQVDGKPLLSCEVDATEWEQNQEILYFLGTLPLRQRQVMAWTFDGYTASEIAAELHMTSGAVRSSLKLARRALTAKLRQKGEGPR